LLYRLPLGISLVAHAADQNHSVRFGADLDAAARFSVTGPRTREVVARVQPHPRDATGAHRSRCRTHRLRGHYRKAGPSTSPSRIIEIIWRICALLAIGAHIIGLGRATELEPRPLLRPRASTRIEVRASRGALPRTRPTGAIRGFRRCSAVLSRAAR